MTVLNVIRRPVTVIVQGRGLMGFKGDKGDPGNLTGPASSVNENIPIFDGVTGDKLKDSGVKLSDKADVDDVADALALKADVAAIQIANRVYDGVDLTTKFATEIAEYDDAWAWIKARITAVDYSGLNIGDYIPFTLGASATIWAQIAGIDTYYKTGDTAIGHHIDFISKDCMDTMYKWNETATNNGSAVNAAPWMVSALKATLDGLVTNLPAGLQSVVIEKRTFLETRYSSSGVLTNSIGVAVNNMGKLWIPTEYEVFGSVINGTLPYASGQGVQYPIFANSFINRAKRSGISIFAWWLASAAKDNSQTFCFVHPRGYPGNPLAGYKASTALGVPLCFRIG